MSRRNGWRENQARNLGESRRQAVCLRNVSSETWVDFQLTTHRYIPETATLALALKQHCRVSHSLTSRRDILKNQPAPFATISKLLTSRIWKNSSVLESLVLAGNDAILKNFQMFHTFPPQPVHALLTYEYGTQRDNPTASCCETAVLFLLKYYRKQYSANIFVLHFPPTCFI
jgi:hypothetical protein